MVKQCHNHVVYLYDKKQKYSLNITLLQKITYFCLITFTNLLGMLLIIVYLKERTFLFLGGQSSPMPWLFYTACIGMHFLADALDNVIQFGTLSRVSGFLCHGFKWPISSFISFNIRQGLKCWHVASTPTLTMWLLCSHPCPQGLNMFLSQQVFCSEHDKENLVLLWVKNLPWQKLKALKMRVLHSKLVCSHNFPKTSSDN